MQSCIVSDKASCFVEYWYTNYRAENRLWTNRGSYHTSEKWTKSSGEYANVETMGEISSGGTT